MTTTCDDNDKEICFYSGDNLPRGDEADWARRMLYRVFLRSDYPSCIWRYNERQTLRFGLINEMSLFPRGALPADERIPCQIDLLESDGSAVQDLDLQLDRGSFNGLVGGRGSCTLAITSTAPETPRSVFIEMSFPTAAKCLQPPLHVLPLVFGPILLTSRFEQPTGDELFEFYRPLHFAETAPPLLVREQPELAIPGKIWDSAFFVAELACTLITADPQKQQPWTILDLSCGTGVCGIWLAAVLDALKTPCHLFLTDLEEALPVIQANLARASSSSTSTLHALPLSWASEIDLAQLFRNVEACSGSKAIDLVLACDLIYEAELLPLLAQTLRDVAQCSTRPTRIIVGYKQRGLTRVEKESLWCTFEETCGFQVEQVKEAACERMMTSAVEAQYVGVELWLLTRLYK